MQYSFKSVTPHNFRSIAVRQLPHFIWPLVFLGIVQFVFPETELAKNNWHIYMVVLAGLFGLYNTLSADSVDELVVDTEKKTILIRGYNIFQGHFEQGLPFSKVKIDIKTGRTGKTGSIEFYEKKGSDYILEKKKDNFMQQDLDALKELLYTITSPYRQ